MEWIGTKFVQWIGTSLRSESAQVCGVDRDMFVEWIGTSVWSGSGQVCGVDHDKFKVHSFLQNRGGHFEIRLGSHAYSWPIRALFSL